jgi:hypothetical protein
LKPHPPQLCLRLKKWKRSEKSEVLETGERIQRKSPARGWRKQTVCGRAQTIGRDVVKVVRRGRAVDVAAVQRNDRKPKTARYMANKPHFTHIIDLHTITYTQ